MEWLQDLGKYANKNASGLNALGNVAGGVAQVGGAYLGYKAMQDQNKLMQQQNNLAMMNYNRNIGKEDLAQNNINNGFSGLSYGGQKKKKQLGTYYAPQGTVV